MSTNLSPARLKARAAALEAGIKAANLSTAAKIRNASNKFLANLGALTAPAGHHGAFALENLEIVPVRNQAFTEGVDTNSLSSFMSDLKTEVGLADRHIEQVGVSALEHFEDTGTWTNVLRATPENNGSYIPLSAVVGQRMAASFGRGEDRFAMEAFGEDTSRLASDDRLTLDLIIMRPFDNIIDKGLARVTDSSPIVTIRIPRPEAWDWAKTQESGSTYLSRNGASNTYPLRDLFRNPVPVNSAPKKIIPLEANDTDDVLWGGSNEFYKAGRNVSVLDLARDAARFTYDHVDRSDLVADGGKVDKVIISIKDGAATEYFLLETSAYGTASFVPSPSSTVSSQRQALVLAQLGLNIYSNEYDGAGSSIAAKLTDAKLDIEVRLNAILNIQTGQLNASGSTVVNPVGINGNDISATTRTWINTLVVNVEAYSVDIHHNEENQRKANLAIWCQYNQVQFPIPRSRVYFTEYSLTQDVDENAISATSSIVALGNGRRGLDTIVDALNETALALRWSADNPEIIGANAIDEQSFASSLVKPTVLYAEIDYDNEDVNTMNESTRLVEIHGRFRHRLLAVLTSVMAKSLMLNQYKGGETPVFKAWTHSTIADLVVGITDYNPALNDVAAKASGADWSMTLPNGYRLDVIKSNWDCLQNRMYVVPVIESAADSVLSFGSIRDCGTVTTNYSPTNQGSVVRRIATTTREIVMVSNKVGALLEIRGIRYQVGDVEHDSLTLGANYTEDLNL